ncbi:MAG: hypothetical protein JXQ27_04670 [Acidobacteria bacterium]|nr:hypothetical protein [Acidobacteriota bacterium]
MKNALCLAGCLLLATGSLTAAIPQSERDALIAIYNTTGGADWVHSDNWLGAPGTECTWYGVVCDPSESHVIELDLSNYPDGNNLTGPFPVSVTALTELTVLTFYKNNLTGPIPPEIGNLSQLEILTLSSNDLSGPLPTELGQLSQLDSLVLSNNRFSGPLPTELGNLPTLRSLRANNNDLSGSIPTQLGNIATLDLLNLSNNELTGIIPSELSLTIIYRLYLDGNNLSGPIPPELGNLAGLQYLYLSYNELTGKIPSQLGQLPNLYILALQYNQLSGAIPPEMGQCDNLWYWDADHNELTGSLPPELGDMAEIRSLDFAMNRLSGPIPPEVGSLATLESLRLQGNRLSGQLPAELTGLTAMQQGTSSYGFNIDYNALYTHDDTLRQFVNGLDRYGDFEARQTVAPADVTWTFSKADGVLSWQIIPFSSYLGQYEIWGSPIQGGPYERLATTASLQEDSVPLSGLDPAGTYYLRVRSITFDHSANKNDVTSEFCPELPVGQEHALRKYYAAHVADDDGWWSRLTVVNIGSESTPLLLAAVDEAGAMVEMYALADLAPGEVLDETVDAFFSPEAFAAGVWVVLAADAPLAGVASFGTRDDQTTVTIPISETKSRTLVYPYVISSQALGYFTGITLVNPEDQETVATLWAYSETGELLDRTQVVIPPFAKYVRLLEWMFDVPDLAAIRFVKVEAPRPLLGFELFGNYVDAGLAGLPSFIPRPVAQKPAEKDGYSVFYNEIPDPGTYYTGITVSNMGDADAQLQMTLYDADGDILSQMDWPDPVAPGEQVTREIWNMLDGTVHRDAAYLKIFSMDEPIMGFELFLSESGPFRFDGASGNTWTWGDLVFPLVADPATWDNYLRIANSGGTRQDVFISAYDAGGTLLDTEVVHLAAGAQLQADVAQFFSGLNVAWLRLKAAQPTLVGDLLYVAHDLSRMSCYLGIEIPRAKD